MNRLVTSRLLFSISLLLTSSTSSEAQPTYRVDHVHGKLILELPAEERRVDAGDELVGGQVLRTGWFSEADLSVSPLATRFHLDNRTRVELASDVPGLILRIEKGRARLLFDRLTGEETPARRVETPAALLAVRGTEYGVAVDRRGGTVVVVFDGVVDVSRRDRQEESVRVEAGFSLRILGGRPLGTPSPHGLSQRAWDHGSMPTHHGSPGQEGMIESGHDRSPSSGHSPQGGGHHGG